VPKITFSISLNPNSPQVGTQVTTTLNPSGAVGQVTYQWSRSTSSTGTFTAISGATSSSYTPTATDVGYFLKVVATGTGSYTGTVSSTLTSAVVALPSDVGETLGTAMAVSFVSDSFTTTQKIGDGAYGNKDVDMYSITVTAADVGKKFTFRTALPAGGTSVDTYIRLFNSSGTQLAYNDDDGCSLYSYLVWTPTAVGTYYLGVSSYGNRGYNPSTANSGAGGTTGDYTLTITR